MKTSTDLQSRLSYIKEAADKIKNLETSTDTERQLAYFCSYLAGILHKHLSTGET